LSARACPRFPWPGPAPAAVGEERGGRGGPRPGKAPGSGRTQKERGWGGAGATSPPRGHAANGRQETCFGRETAMMTLAQQLWPALSLVPQCPDAKLAPARQMIIGEADWLSPCFKQDLSVGHFVCRWASRSETSHGTAFRFQGLIPASPETRTFGIRASKRRDVCGTGAPS